MSRDFDQYGGETRRGLPADYAGDDPDSCNARTKSGGFCRAHGLENGRCKWHGGKSTGPNTPEGRAAIARSNLARRIDKRLTRKSGAWPGLTRGDFKGERPKLTLHSAPEEARDDQA